MDKNLLIIISGPSGSGKTTLANFLAKKLKLPLLAKDDFKESFFDFFGWKDREWSKKIGQACYAIIYHFAEKLLARKTSFIMESNFKNRHDAKKILALQKKYQPLTVQLFCIASNKILIKRFADRVVLGQRHPGHDDQNNIGNLPIYIKRTDTPLKIQGKLIKIKTDDFKKVSYKKIIKQIKSLA